MFRRLNAALDKTVVSEDGSNHKREIGKTVARDFGEAGVFTGEIVEVYYDSEDVEKVEPIYVVLYTDGDREDMDSKEMHTLMNCIFDAWVLTWATSPKRLVRMKRNAIVPHHPR